MISETKRINIFDTKTFTAIAAVAAKGVPYQNKYTHEMEFEFTVKQRLFTKFLTYFPNPPISTSMNNNKNTGIITLILKSP